MLPGLSVSVSVRLGSIGDWLSVGDLLVAVGGWLGVDDLLAIGGRLCILDGLRVDDLLVAVGGLRVDDLLRGSMSVSAVTGMLLLVRLVTATESETGEAATKSATSEETLEAHSWLELLAEASIRKLILKGLSAEGRSVEDLSLGSTTYLYFRLVITVDFNGDLGLDLKAFLLDLTADLELRADLGVSEHLEIAAGLNLTAKLGLEAGLDLDTYLTFV